jgi:hypothetical protein
VDAGIQTGDPVAGFEASVLAGTVAAASYSVLTIVTPAANAGGAAAAAKMALDGALVGVGAYNTYEGFRHDTYASAAVGVVSVAVGLYGDAQSIGAPSAKAETGPQGGNRSAGQVMDHGPNPEQMDSDAEEH